jgi:hypothetical protein
MNHAKNRSRARLGGLLALALGVAALLAIPVVSAARQGADDGPNHEANHETEHHNGGHHNGRHHHRTVVGTIASFDAGSGLLTIDLSGGGSVSGIADGRTKIRCEDQEVERHHNRGGDRRGRSGEAEPGDDHGGGANCTTADLVAGADIQEADLEVEHGTRHFDEVELAH